MDLQTYASHAVVLGTVVNAAEGMEKLFFGVPGAAPNMPFCSAGRTDLHGRVEQQFTRQVRASDLITSLQTCIGYRRFRRGVAGRIRSSEDVLDRAGDVEICTPLTLEGLPQT